MNATMFPEPFSIHIGVDLAEMARLEQTARSRGMTVFRLDFTGLEDLDALVDYLARTFMFPHRIAGLDAALDLISDLEWFGSEGGYLVSVQGSAGATVLAELFASILPNIVDGWRARDIPFVAVIDGKGHRLQTALLAENREMDRAGNFPWAQPGTGRVDVVVHQPGERRRGWEEHMIEVAPYRYLSVRELIASWAAHISRLAAEINSAERNDSWGVDDFIAAVCIRDFLSQAQADLSPEETHACDAALNASDREFRRLTVSDPSRSIASLGGFAAREGWWWERVPPHGPVAVELASRLREST